MPFTGLGSSTFLDSVGGTAEDARNDANVIVALLAVAATAGAANDAVRK